MNWFFCFNVIEPDAEPITGWLFGFFKVGTFSGCCDVVTAVLKKTAPAVVDDEEALAGGL